MQRTEFTGDLVVKNCRPEGFRKGEVSKEKRKGLRDRGELEPNVGEVRIKDDQVHPKGETTWGNGRRTPGKKFVKPKIVEGGKTKIGKQTTRRERLGKYMRGGGGEKRAGEHWKTMGG